MSTKNIDKELDDTVIEHIILEKVGRLKGHHFLPKKKSKKAGSTKGSNLWLYLMLFYIVVIAVILVQKNQLEKYGEDIHIWEATTKIMHLYDFPNNSLYSFCRVTGINESAVRELNPWINKKASNISADAEIVVPIH